ncbi:MAG: hypothetical protein KJN63_00300 [Acidimicrobiia bacterium]|nr:hypothetical protein [Acidimicrobiia bacterium]
MTENSFGANSQPKKLDPFTEQRVGERLRAALADHADRVEPAPNSYLTLSKRLEEAVQQHPKPPTGRNGRILAAAAMFLVIAGAGAFAITQTRTGDVNAVGSDGPTETIPDQLRTTTTIPAEETSTTVATVVPTTTPPPEVGAAVVDQVDLPEAENPAKAAAEFVHLLGLPGSGRFTVQANTVDVLPPGNVGSDPPPIAFIQTEGSGNRTRVVNAISETMVISDVFVENDEIVVRGEGIAFEASVEVKLISTDGTPLAFDFTSAGCCEDLVPFEARLPMVNGSGEGFVVAHGDNAGSGVLPAFAATPITFNGPPDKTTYSVFRIRPDDSDQGLNIRDLPGTDEGQVLVTLPPGHTGIRRLPTMPALVGDSFWWEVETDTGLRGWVHSSFLVPDSSGPTDVDLVEQARFALYGINAADFDGLSAVPLSRRVPMALGWIGDPQVVTGPEISDARFWTVASEWSVPEATYGEPEKVISLRSLLNPPNELDVEPEIQVGAATIYGFEEEFVDSYFAGTRAVTVIGPETDGEPPKSMMLFYEVTPVGPQLVGVVVSIFVP